MNLTAEEARTNLRRNRASLWPDGRRANDRLGKYAKCDTKPGFQFSQDDLIFTTGSCFARNIEKKLAALGFKLPMLEMQTPRIERVSETANAILNKYTTASVLNELRWAMGLADFPAQGFLPMPGELVHDPYLNPGMPPVSLDRARERRADIHRLVSILPQCRVFIMTLGLVETWFDNTTGLYMNGPAPRDCIDNDPDRFSFRLQSFSDILADLEAIHDLLTEHGHPDFKFLLSVSPVPFKATYSGQDAMVANTYSKSVLRAAAEEFSRAHDNVDYFPSYEIVVLSERGSAYEPDNIHVQPEMVGRIMDIAAKKYVPGFSTEGEGTKFSVSDADPAAVYRDAVTYQINKRPDIASDMLLHIERTTELESIGLDPANFYLMLGTTLARAGRHVEAEPHLYRAVALAPEHAAASYRLGLTTSKLGRKTSIIHFERACSLDSSVPDYFWGLGIAYDRAKKYDEGIAAQKAALALNPGHEKARVTLELMEARIETRRHQKAARRQSAAM